MRHTQGDQWDLLLLYPMGSFHEYYEPGRTDRRLESGTQKGMSERHLKDEVDRLTSWRDEMFVRGPESRWWGRASPQRILPHRNVRSPGRSAARTPGGASHGKPLSPGHDRPQNLIFVREAGGPWDSFTLGFYRDLKHYPRAQISLPRPKDEAARAAGFEGADKIGSFLRRFILYHQDTLCVAIGEGFPLTDPEVNEWWRRTKAVLGPPPVRVFGLCPGVCVGPDRLPNWQGVISDFAAQLSQDVKADGSGGITAGIVLGRDLVWAQGFGWADVERGIPAGVNTIYRVGSISKSFTAVALLQLWERGFLELDDRVREVLPELQELRDRPEACRSHHLPPSGQSYGRPDSGAQLEGSTKGPLEFWEDKILSSIPTTAFYAPPGSPTSTPISGSESWGIPSPGRRVFPSWSWLMPASSDPSGMHLVRFRGHPGHGRTAGNRL